MTEDQKRAVKLIDDYENLKSQMKSVQDELDKIIAKIPANEMFQDPDTKIVYRVVPQTGTFVQFKPLIYQRSRKMGEAKGTISKVEAEAAGFSL